MELTGWQQTYLAGLDEVPGLDAEETRLLVGRFAFGAGEDDEVAAVLRSLDTSDPEWLAVTMFSLGVATGHASEARLAQGSSMVDLRESVEIEPTRETTVAASALTAAVTAEVETAFDAGDLTPAPTTYAPGQVFQPELEHAVPMLDPRPSVPAQRRSSWSLTAY